MAAIPNCDVYHRDQERPLYVDSSRRSNVSNAQKAVKPDDMANGPIDLNHVPRRLTSAEAQALGAIESRPA